MPSCEPCWAFPRAPPLPRLVPEGFGVDFDLALLPELDWVVRDLEDLVELGFRFLVPPADDLVDLVAFGFLALVAAPLDFFLLLLLEARFDALGLVFVFV